MLFPSKFTYKIHKNLMNTEKFEAQKFIHDEYGCSEAKTHSQTQRLNSTNDSRNSQNEQTQKLVRRFYDLKTIQSEMTSKFSRYLERLERQLSVRESSNVQICGQISRVKGEIQETREDIKKIKSYAINNHIDLVKESEYGKQRSIERKRGSYGLRRCWDELNY